MGSPTKGKKSTWSQLYVSDRPRDLFGLSLAEEADFDAFIGFTGRDQDGNVVQKNIIYWNSATAPDLEDYADFPIGTIIVAPKLTASKIYMRKAKSSPSVVGDWYGVAFTQET
jgi:hypothetical protein